MSVMLRCVAGEPASPARSTWCPAPGKRLAAPRRRALEWLAVSQTHAMAKHCFMDAKRPCTMDCKAAFEVDDARDPVECTFLWLAQNLGEGAWAIKETVEKPSPPPGAKKGPPGGLN